MKLTKKCKIEFDKWLKIPQEKNPSTANTMDRNNFADMFYGLPDEAQIGSYQLYFDSVGIDTGVVRNYLGTFNNWAGNIPSITDRLPTVKLREQAWKQAVKKANIIRNKKLN